MDAEQCHTEISFSHIVEDGSGTAKLLHGVIDLAYRNQSGWELVDYKTDQVDDGGELLERYRDQLSAYATSWARVVKDGLPVRVGGHAVRLGSTHWLASAKSG